jgi:RHS repeat-associated protein
VVYPLRWSLSGLHEITNNGCTYDNNGNLTGDGNLTYTYNALDQLIQVRRASDNSLVATYTYNHDGARRSKTTSQGTTNYDWDASGALIRESTPAGVNCYYYVAGKLTALKTNGNMYITHDNLRGDIESITDASKTIVAQYHFDPWGDQISYSGTLTQPFRYAGYYYDSETGLYYLKSRYYSPTLGRFLTRNSHKSIKDKDPQTLNL